MPEREPHVDLADEPHGFDGYLEPEAVADTLGDFSNSQAFETVLRQVLPAVIVHLCDEHRPNKPLWRCLLEMINTLMQSELDGNHGPLMRIEFEDLQDMHDWFLAVNADHKPALMAIFGLDANGQALPRDFVNPFRGNTYLRNVFRRKYVAGPVFDFYAIPIEEWKTVMGITFFLDVLQDINSIYGPPGQDDYDSAVESASDDEINVIRA